jgi:hypothetical protein
MARRVLASPALWVATGAGVLAVVAVVVSVTRSTPSNRLAASPQVRTVTVTTTLTQPDHTITVTDTIADSSPPSTPSRVPQGTVTDTFSNAGDIDTSCADVTLYVHNRSDTAVLSVTVSFKTDYSGYPTPSGDLRDQVVSEHTTPETAAVGVAPYSDRPVQFRECVTPPFHVDEPNRSMTSAIPALGT